MNLLDPAIWSERLFSVGLGTGQRWRGGRRRAGDGERPGAPGVATQEDVTKAATAAAQAQREWAAASYEERAAVLRRAGQLWLDHAADIESWIVREACSIPSKAAMETHVASQECFEAAALPSLPSGSVLPSAEPRWSLARRRPAGWSR